MTIPTLQFDFHLSNKAQIESILFTEPIDIVSTNDINKILSSLEQIETAINDGYYVAGFMSYEATYAFYKISHTIEESTLPLLWFGVFKQPMNKRLQRKHGKFHIDKWTINEQKHMYVKNVNEILERINQGETKQVNYTVPFETSFDGNSFAYYERLKNAQQAKYSAYLQLNNFDILSVSPEMLFSIENGTITVKPMKGTVNRGKTYNEDIMKRNWLQQSEKNKIENDLITNLMEDELLSVANNVHIEKRYTIEKYPTVYQMTSTIKGNLKHNIHPVQVLKTLFPCGSITGVPKHKTIEIIANTERKNRGVYCGAIGFFTPTKEAVFNVPIRTVTINKAKNIAKYNAGGAITAQSTPEEEYKELMTKTKVLHKIYPNFKLLETILLTNGNLFLLQKHIRRLIQSAQYFDFKLNLEKLNETFNFLRRTYQNGVWRIRLLVDRNGTLTTEVFPLEKTEKAKIILANKPIDKSNVFLYHKTTERSMFDEHRSLLTKEDLDVLLWNERGEITEFTIGNVVVEKNGELITPPIQSGLLPGTFREQLLEDGIIKEDPIFVEELHNVSSIWLINSVRKWVRVTLKN